MQSGEAPLNSGRLQRLEGLVDLTLTYRQDSDIVRTLVLQQLLPETLIHLTGHRNCWFLPTIAATSAAESCVVYSVLSETFLARILTCRLHYPLLDTFALESFALESRIICTRI